MLSGLFAAGELLLLQVTVPWQPIGISLLDIDSLDAPVLFVLLKSPNPATNASSNPDMGYDSIEFGQAPFSEGEPYYSDARRNTEHYAELRCRLRWPEAWQRVRWRLMSCGKVQPRLDHLTKSLVWNTDVESLEAKKFAQYHQYTVPQHLYGKCSLTRGLPHERDGENWMKHTVPFMTTRRARRKLNTSGHFTRSTKRVSVVAPFARVY
jgi:hypothetical protein